MARRKPARKGVNGAAKGAAFERLIAKRFSLWISGGKTEDWLWRSAGSGGRSTQRAKATGKGIEYHAADIAPLHPDAKPFSDAFILECKSYKSIELRQVVYDWSASLVAKWWEQAVRDSRAVSRQPLLVIKENQKPPLLVLREPPGEPYYFVRDAFLHCTQIHAAGVLLVPLDDVLNTVPFESFRNLYALPRSGGQRSASHGQRTRRVPLENL